MLDSVGNIKSFARIDEAWECSGNIAIRKTKTAYYYAMPSGEIGNLSILVSPLYGIEHSIDGLNTFPEGVPIVSKECNMLGKLGVSVDTVENYHNVAVAGATRCVQI